MIAVAHAVSRTRAEEVEVMPAVDGANATAEDLPHLFAMLSSVVNVTVVRLAASAMVCYSFQFCPQHFLTHEHSL